LEVLTSVTEYYYIIYLIEKKNHVGVAYLHVVGLGLGRRPRFLRPVSKRLVRNFAARSNRTRIPIEASNRSAGRRRTNRFFLPLPGDSDLLLVHPLAADRSDPPSQPPNPRFARPPNRRRAQDSDLPRRLKRWGRGCRGCGS
jgi:hypothetical protein